MADLPALPFERTAAALARVWLDVRIDGKQAHAEAAGLIDGWRTDAVNRHPEHGGTDEARLRALSLAFESLRKAALRLASDADALETTENHLQAVRAMGWPRATALAEVAWAWTRIFEAPRAAQTLALLQAQQGRLKADPSFAAGLPALERVWLDAATSALSCLQGHHDQALACGLRAEAWADQADHDAARLAVAQILAFVYLSVGDLEAASSVLSQGLAARKRCGHPGMGMPINQLLALVLRRRFDEAASLLEELPDLGSACTLSALPMVKSLVARVRLHQGLREAAADLPAPGWSPAGFEPHTAAANRLWVGADVLVALGRHEEARQQLQAGLQAFAEAGVSLLPMNATQLHRALADACEAAGDLPAALAALRQSQAHCFNWVGQSLRARLQALHFNTPPGTAGDRRRRQDRRLAQVERALAAAQQDSLALQADLADRHKLLAEVTHEVRNPLHGVVWMTSLLMMSDLDKRQREYLDLANSSARMALSLCNDVLDLARMEAGRLQLRLEPLQLDALVAECARIHVEPARAKGVDLAWHCDAGMPRQLLGDRLRLQQVLMNLLGNATKFTQAGRIEVGVNWLGDQGSATAPTVRLSVSDTGKGLPAELLPRLFQEFEQAASPAPAPAAGAGLGLALCRQFVRLMGGEIGVDNRPGQGCTFWCLLPLPAA